MADEGSVAPKERVNIVYKPDTGGMQEEIELPLRILVLGDFTGVESDPTAIEKREVLSVDKDNFQEILKGQKVLVKLDVEDTITGAKDARLHAELLIESLEDFEPDNLLDKLRLTGKPNEPNPLQELMELQQALIELKGPLDQQDKARDRLQRLLEELEDPTKRKSFLEDFGVGATTTDTSK